MQRGGNYVSSDVSMIVPDRCYTGPAQFDVLEDLASGGGEGSSGLSTRARVDYILLVGGTRLTGLKRKDRPE